MKQILAVTLLAVALSGIGSRQQCAAQSNVVTKARTTYAELNTLADWIGGDAAIFEQPTTLILRLDRRSLVLRLADDNKIKRPLAVKVGSLYYVPLNALPSALGVSIRIDGVAQTAHIAFDDNTSSFDMPVNRSVTKNHIRLVPKPLLEAVIQYRIGKARFTAKKYTVAEATLRKAVELSPGFSDAELTLADTYAAMGRKTDAIAWYQKVLNGVTLDNQWTHARNGLANLLDRPKRQVVSNPPVRKRQTDEASNISTVQVPVTLSDLDLVVGDYDAILRQIEQDWAGWDKDKEEESQNPGPELLAALLDQDMRLFTHICDETGPQALNLYRVIKASPVYEGNYRETTYPFGRDRDMFIPGSKNDPIGHLRFIERRSKIDGSGN